MALNLDQTIQSALARSHSRDTRKKYTNNNMSTSRPVESTTLTDSPVLLNN